MKDVTKHAESGFEIKRLYTPDDASGRYEEALGEPGAYPFTRHVYPTGYRVRAWQPSLYSGFGDPVDANRRFRYLLAQGNGRANIAVDLPTQIGYDSDHELAEHEVGRVGVALDSLADMEILLDGLPLEEVPVSMNANTMAPVMLAMLVAVARKQGARLDRLTGTLANDILHEYIARGTWRYEVEPSLRLMADTAEFVVREMPRFYPFNVRGLLLHESGASPPQESGFCLAIAREYIERLLRRDLRIDDFAPRISFFFGTGLHLFEEAAKFRATRRVWARMLRDDFGATSPRSQGLRFTCVAGCGSHFTKQTPELNLVRGTLGCLAAALGGAQTMLGTSLDEAYEIPTERTQLLALRTQQIVALESDVASTVDPLGGSYFVESMTEEIERLIEETMARCDNAYGGVVAAVESGAIRAEIEARAYDVQRRIDSGERPWVGVNVHRPEDGDEHEIELWKPDERLLATRLDALARLRKERSAARVEAALAGLARAAQSDANVMPAVLEAVEAYATIGEIASTFERVFGRFREPVAV